jgi:hypothetical protein
MSKSFRNEFKDLINKYKLRKRTKIFIHKITGVSILEKLMNRNDIINNFSLETSLFVVIKPKY